MFESGGRAEGRESTVGTEVPFVRASSATRAARLVAGTANAMLNGHLARTLQTRR